MGSVQVPSRKAAAQVLAQNRFHWRDSQPVELSTVLYVNAVE